MSSASNLRSIDTAFNHSGQFTSFLTLRLEGVDILVLTLDGLEHIVWLRHGACGTFFHLSFLLC